MLTTPVESFFSVLLLLLVSLLLFVDSFLDVVPSVTFESLAFGILLLLSAFVSSGTLAVCSVVWTTLSLDLPPREFPKVVAPTRISGANIINITTKTVFFIVLFFII